MEALKRKWNSCRGASILLALLFLLVCILVGASVVMAAASNAGKIRSNKAEQQKYLTLSSAVDLFAGELESVKYVGTYTYKRQTVYKDDAGNLETTDGSIPDGCAFDHYRHIYTQGEGELEGASWLGDLLPLQKDLNYIFKQNFKVDDDDKIPEDEYDINRLPDTSVTAPAAFYTLEFKVDDEGYGGLSDDKVSIKAERRNDGSFILTATLYEKQADGDWKPTTYTMKALLSPNDRPDKLLVPASSPTPGVNKTAPISWTLEYIYKEEVIPVAAPAPTT